jgi:hypothetical protein
VLAANSWISLIAKRICAQQSWICDMLHAFGTCKASAGAERDAADFVIGTSTLTIRAIVISMVAPQRHARTTFMVTALGGVITACQQIVVTTFKI